MRMLQQVVERQQASEHDVRRGGPAVADVLNPEQLVDPPCRDAAQTEPGAVPLLFNCVLSAAADEAVRQRGIGAADEGEVLGAEEHAAVQADQRQPLCLATGPAVRYQRRRPLFKMSKHRFAFTCIGRHSRVGPAIEEAAHGSISSRGHESCLSM